MARTPKQKEQALQQYKDSLIRSRLEVLPAKAEEGMILHHKCLGLQGDVELHAVTYKVDDTVFNDTVVGFHKRDFAPGDRVVFRLTKRKNFPVEMAHPSDI